jgi:phage terminase small subunit
MSTSKTQLDVKAATVLKSKLGGAKPKHLHLEQVYSLLFYEEKVKPVVDNELQTQDSKHHDRVVTRAAITKKLFESEREDVKKRVTDERERIYQEALKKWTDAQDAVDSVKHQQQYVFLMKPDENLANVMRI